MSNKYKNTISTVTRCAEINVWNVHTENVPKTKQTKFEFCRFTPAGQDFSFSATMVDDDLYSLVRDVGDYYDCFDPDARTYLWLDSSGHGKNGAPHRMRDVLEDMETARKMIGYLYLSLQELESVYA